MPGTIQIYRGLNYLEPRLIIDTNTPLLNHKIIEKAGVFSGGSSNQVFSNLLPGVAMTTLVNGAPGANSLFFVTFRASANNSTLRLVLTVPGPSTITYFFEIPRANEHFFVRGFSTLQFDSLDLQFNNSIVGVSHSGEAILGSGARQLG